MWSLLSIWCWICSEVDGFSNFCSVFLNLWLVSLSSHAICQILFHITAIPIFLSFDFYFAFCWLFFVPFFPNLFRCKMTLFCSICNSFFLTFNWKIWYSVFGNELLKILNLECLIWWSEPYFAKFLNHGSIFLRRVKNHLVYSITVFSIICLSVSIRHQKSFIPIKSEIFSAGTHTRVCVNFSVNFFNENFFYWL